jgi:hypothetical protein
MSRPGYALDLFDVATKTSTWRIRADLLARSKRTATESLPLASSVRLQVEVSSLAPS